MIVSGVEYIKEVLFLGMAAGGDTAMMRTDKDTVESVVWERKTYDRLADDVVLDVTDGTNTQLWITTFAERGTLYAAVLKTCYQRSDLRRALINSKEPEYTPPIKGVYYLAARKPDENLLAFQRLKNERNKWIGMLFRAIEAVKEFEKLDCFTVDTIKHVRRVFLSSFVATRGDATNLLTVKTVVQERNDLLADFPAAIQKRNELVPAWNIGKKTKRHLLATKPKVKQWSDDLINPTTFASDGGVDHAMSNFKRYINERDALYEELHQISDEIVEMTAPAAAAFTAAGANDAGGGVKPLNPRVPTLAGASWTDMVTPKPTDKADAAAINASVGQDGSTSEDDDDAATGAAPAASKKTMLERATDQVKAAAAGAKTAIGFGSKPPVGAKGVSPAASTVQSRPAAGGGPAAQAPPTVVNVASYTPSTLSLPRGVGPNSEGTDTPAASGRGGAHATIIEDGDLTTPSALQVVQPEHTGQSGGGVSDDEFKEIVVDPELAQVKAELRQKIAELADSKEVNAKNLAWFDNVGVQLGKTAKTTTQSLVLKLVAFEKNVRGLVQGDTTLTQDQMVEAIAKHIAEKPALIAEIRHEIAKVDPARDDRFKDDVVKSVQSYVEEAAEVFNLCSHGTAVTDHGALINHIQTQVKSMETLVADYKKNLTEMNRIAQAVNDKERQDSTQIIAHINNHKQLMKGICQACGNVGEDVVLDSVQTLKTTYKTFEGQIAALIPAEIDKDVGGKVLSVLERATEWSTMTAAIKHVAETGLVGDVVRQVQGFKEDLDKIGVAAAAAGGGGADAAAAASAAEILRITKERSKHFEDQFNQSQTSLLDAQLAKLEAEKLQRESDAKLLPLEAELAHLQDALNDACEDLDAAREPMKPFVMNTRMVSLLNDLHHVLHIDFAKNTRHDQGRILKDITRTIFNAFRDDRKVDAVRQLMYGMMVEFEIEITDKELYDAAVASRVYVAGLRGGGTHGRHVYGEHEDEDDERLRSTMRRRSAEEDAPEDAGIHERTYLRPRAEVVEGGDEATRRRTGAFWAGRAEDIDGGRDSWTRLPESRTYHADTSQRRPPARPGEAHMECVSNWLHDLSQMIEPMSP